MNKKNLILIVGHRTSLLRSLTLCSLLNNPHISECTVIFWNNGSPKITSQIDGVRVISTTQNVSLSRIYNIILKLDFDRTFIFDSDTEVPNQYLKIALKTPTNFIGLPVVKSSVTSRTISPTNCSMSHSLLILNRESSFITSGIVIGKHAKQRLMNGNGAVFDERFTFYGIDTMLARLLARSNEKLVKLPPIQHSLSRENPIQSLFHRRQRGIALGRLLLYGQCKRDKRMFLIILIKSLVWKNELICVRSIFGSIIYDLSRKSKRRIN